jgi:catechol 2,3-dioxygenase-like lactoylglutathione lyase family enzyme
VFDHVGLSVGGLEASTEFYRTVLAPLGIEQTSTAPVEFGALSLVQRSPVDRVHIAFIAETREAVEAFHRAGIEAGFRDNGGPGIRSYAPDYFAAYLFDPDGHNVEAVHRSPETRAGWSWLGKGLIR